MTDEIQDFQEVFPTQRIAQEHGIPDEDLALGAPHAPFPKSWLVDDRRLTACNRLTTFEEAKEIQLLRSEFRVGNYPDPYISDVSRAFRLLKNKKAYLEIGTFDRGNLAYVSQFLADDALLIGLDIQDEPQRDALLRSKLKKGQTYLSIVGSSRARSSVDAVKRALAGQQLDAIFIDGDHTAYAVLNDYANFEQLVADDGIIFFHDSAWEGNQQHKGVVDALDEINRHDPVYLIDGENPVRAFSRPMWRQELWGVVGVVFAADQKWRRYK